MSELHVFVTFNDLSWADYARELLLAGLPSAVRLVNPPTDGAGNLQVYSNGQWSDVCSRYFSYREADVICRELGYEFGGKRYKSVPAVSPGMVQWVQCYGDETGLGECAVGGIGSVCSDSDQNTVQLYCNTEVFISHFSLCLTWKILLGVFLVGFILIAGLHLHAESRRKAKRDLEKSKSVQQQFVEPTFVVIPQQKGHVGVFIPPKQ